MAQITEDYVRFEIAKLLKEKGFDEQTRDFYRYENNIWIHRNTYEHNHFNLGMPRWENCYSCPTLQMAMKWLREVHNIHITILYNSFLYGTHPYYWSVDKIDTIPRANTQIEISTNTHNYSFVHYETACEAAIKYCLENLI